jgi:hypothetical protein
MAVKLIKIAISLGLIFSFFSCEKDRLPLGLHFQMNVNGKITHVEACGSSAYVAQYLRDTAVTISISCGTSAGFFLQGKIIDGIYNLDGKNIAFYSPLDGSGYKSYSTSDQFSGTLIISSIQYENQKALKGIFNFKAVERNSGEVIEVSKGTFLLRKYNY